MIVINAILSNAILSSSERSAKRIIIDDSIETLEKLKNLLKKEFDLLKIEKICVREEFYSHWCGKQDYTFPINSDIGSDTTLCVVRMIEITDIRQLMNGDKLYVNTS